MHSRTNMRKFCLATTALFAFAVTSSATPVGLCNSGVVAAAPCTALATQGTFDTHWTVSDRATSPVASPIGLTYSADLVSAPGAGIGADGISQWIRPGQQPGQSFESYLGGYYVYQIMFTADAADAVTGRWVSDNEGIAVFLNGVQIPGFPLPGPSDSGSVWTAFNLSGFVTGSNTLDFEVRNRGGGGIDSNPTPSGFRVEFSGVPEPATYAMMGGGLLALGLLRRRMGAKTKSA